MSRNWGDFKKAHTSNLDVTSPNQGSANIGADLARAGLNASSSKKIFINGVPLNTIVLAYKKFEDDKQVEDFFSEVLLRDFKGTNIEKTKAVDYLKRTFHQGGLMYPVSSVIATGLKDKEGKILCSPMGGHEESIVNIQTTREGIRIQEITKVNQVIFLNPSKTPTTGPIMAREEGAESLIRAEATIAIHFKNSDKPSFNVESNRMDSNLTLKKDIDNRKLGQKIADYFKNKFPFFAVKDISPQKPDLQLESQLQNKINKFKEDPQEEQKLEPKTLGH